MPFSRDNDIYLIFNHVYDYYYCYKKNINYMKTHIGEIIFTCQTMLFD